MSGYIDLHCHYIPGVDDGVKTLEACIELCRGLVSLGFSKAIATPHIRTAMFPNRREELQQRFETLRGELAGVSGLPELGLGAEHFFDDVFWELMRSGELLSYPGASAALVELPAELFPVPLTQCIFEMNMKRVRPVLAHPERYAAVGKSVRSLDAIRDSGALLQLDLMSLDGKYGRQARKAAEALLEEDAYFLAGTDVHRPEDLPSVARAIEALDEHVGTEGVQVLLAANPAAVLDGTAEP